MLAQDPESSAAALNWLSAAASGTIALACLVIAALLFRFTRRRPDIAVSWVFYVFSGLVLISGLTHALMLSTMWSHRFLHGTAIASTAIVAIVGAVTLWRLLPKAIAMPSQATLAQANAALQASETYLKHRSTHDQLTGLVNRDAFALQAEAALQDAQDGISVHALMYIDLDQFKLVNDTAGHAVGDRLLQEVSALLKGCVRGRDVVARLGGDEFGILLEYCDTEHAQVIGQTICDRMELFRFRHDDHSFKIGASIGLVRIDDAWSSAGAMLQAADTACYNAKEAGRNRVYVWDPADRATQSRHRDLVWINRIEQALDDDGFDLYGQVVEPVKPGGGLHLEVLLRWRDASQGGVGLPGALIAAAERFHMAPRVDRWVLRHTLNLLQANAHLLHRVDTVAINLSGQSIGDRAFHAQVIAMLRNAQFDIGKLCFEITETAAIGNLNDVIPFIEEMRALGVKIALDDFGAGSSSFGYLRVLPVDFLKIDGKFIVNLLADELDHIAVCCFRDAARVRGIKTIAEFVERADIRAELEKIGIDMMQGYLFHHPEPLASILFRLPRALALVVV